MLREADAKLLEFESMKRVDLNYRGDYQEASQGGKRYFASGRRPKEYMIPTGRPRCAFAHVSR